MVELGIIKPRVPRPSKRYVFAGARTTRLEYDWLARILSADQEVRSSLVSLRARSRQQSRDNPYFAAFLNLLRSQVIGPNGIRLQSRIVDGNGKPRTPFNDGIERAWKGWGKPATASVTGRLSWREVQELWLTTVAVDGEVITRHRSGYPNRYGYGIQFVDPDLLDERFDREPGPGVNRVVMGVEVDEDSRPIAYHFRQKHPGEAGGFALHRLRLPASEIQHYFCAYRPNQTRGVPWIAPALLRLKMLDGYAEAELVAARGSAAKPVFYTQSPDSAEDAGEGDIVEDIEPGIAQLLPPGVNVEQLDAQHPSTAFESFNKAMLRSVAAALGVSYNSLASDLESTSFASSRAGMLQERDHWRSLQRRVAEHLCDPHYARWLVMAYTMGQVTLPSSDVFRWTQPAWRPRGWAWVDPMKDIKAAEGEVKLGVTTRSEVCAQRGADYDEVVAQLAREQETADDAGVNVSGADNSGGQDDDENEAGSGVLPNGNGGKGADRFGDSWSYTGGAGGGRLAGLE